MRFNFLQIVSYCLGLHTQNPGLRDVDLEPSPKRSSDKINNNTHHSNPDMNHPPPPPHLSHASPLIYSNKAMDKEFLVQMRQSSKCESVRKDEIFNLHLGSGAGPWGRIPCLVQESSPIYWFHPPKQVAWKKKEPRNEIQLPIDRIVLHWSTYTEPRVKRGRLGTQC